MDNISWGQSLWIRRSEDAGEKPCPGTRGNLPRNRSCHLSVAQTGCPRLRDIIPLGTGTCRGTAWPKIWGGHHACPWAWRLSLGTVPEKPASTVPVGGPWPAVPNSKERHVARLGNPPETHCLRTQRPLRPEIPFPAGSVGAESRKERGASGRADLLRVLESSSVFPKGHQNTKPRLKAGVQSFPPEKSFPGSFRTTLCIRYVPRWGDHGRSGSRWGSIVRERDQHLWPLQDLNKGAQE